MCRHTMVPHVWRSVSLKVDHQNNIIRVKAPMLNKVAMAIQLNEAMCAGNVVAKFRRRPSPSELTSAIGRQSSLGAARDNYKDCLNPHDNNKFAKDDHFLFEMGGNIGEWDTLGVEWYWENCCQANFNPRLSLCYLLYTANISANISPQQFANTSSTPYQRVDTNGHSANTSPTPQHLTNVMTPTVTANTSPLYQRITNCHCQHITNTLPTYH